MTRFMTRFVTRFFKNNGFMPKTEVVINVVMRVRKNPGNVDFTGFGGNSEEET